MSCEVTVFLDGVMVDETVYQHDLKGRNVGVVDSIWVDEHTVREIVFAKTIASSQVCKPSAKHTHLKQELKVSVCHAQTLKTGLDTERTEL